MTDRRKTVTVVTPLRVTWQHRFHDVDAAWGRILSLKGIKDTPANRKQLTSVGWVVGTLK